ncbi:MAG TPA: hypothetical protein VIR78_09105 [Malonomonas sp.]
MIQDQVDDLISKGIEAAEMGYIHSAQAFLDQAAEHRNTPEVLTYQAYCLAKGHGRIHSAAKICQESIQREPHNSLHYLILGRILLMAEEKDKAIGAFRQGLKTSPNQKIIAELKMLGLRKPAVLKSLQRTHPLNRVLGRVFSSIGIR